jgi:hypothetical protein
MGRRKRKEGINRSSSTAVHYMRFVRREGEEEEKGKEEQE